MKSTKAKGPRPPKLPLKLSRRELDLISGEAVSTLRLEEEVRATAVEKGKYVTRLALEDWEEIAGCLTSQSNRCPSPKLQDQFDRLIERIEDLIDENEPE
jgi:hypothetical protein